MGENREQRTTPTLEQYGQLSRGEVRGVVIVSVPGDKTVCAAFTFQDQQRQAPQPNSTNLTTNAPVQPQTMPPPAARPTSRFGKRLRRVVAFLVVLGVAGFFFMRAPTLGQLEEQWDDGEEEWAHVHKLYAKRLISLAPGNGSISDAFEVDGLMQRDIGRRKLWERAVGGATQSGPTVFSMHGNVFPDGLYYMQLMIGASPKPYFLDVDTGSDLTWLQCNAPCAHCAKTPHPWYSPKGAKLVDCRQPVCSLLQKESRDECSAAGGQCDYTIEYGDGSSTRGVLVSDQITVQLTNGSMAQSSVVLGCSYDQRGSLAVSPSKTDGLLGLSRAKLALPAQLAGQGLFKNLIAHCIAGGNHRGGFLFFGDELVPSWGMTWTPMVDKPGNDNYFVSVSKVQYGFSALETTILDHNEFIFDSGTSYTYLAPHLFSAFMTAVEEGLVGSGLERDTSDTTLQYCWRAKTPFNTVSEASRYFHPVTLNFATSWFLAGRTMIIVPQSYLIITPQGNVCMGILDSTETGSGINIIGDISLRGHLVVYDNVQHRIGWIPSDCQKPPKARAFTFV